MTAMSWMLLMVGVLMSALGGLFMKIGAVQIQYTEGIVGIVNQVIFNWKIIIGVLMYIIPVAIWIFLLKKIELSFLQPLFSTVYVVTPFLASMFLHEEVATTRWLGIVVIILGVIIIARN